MGQFISIAAIDAVINGTEVKMPLSSVELRDRSGGPNNNYDGPGMYTIQLSHGLTSLRKYVVTVGCPPPADSDQLMTVHRVTVTPTDDLVFADKRQVNINMAGVNGVIMQTQNADGSWIDDGQVTERTLGPDVQALLQTIPYGSTLPTSPKDGELFYDTSTSELEMYDGTTSSWVVMGGGSTAIGIGSSFPGSPTTGELYFRSDLLALFIYNGSAWKNVDSLAQLNDVMLTSPATNDLLTKSSGAWVNAGLSAIIDAALGSTRGSILERGASGWQVITPGTSTYILTSNGSGADPSWQAPAGGGGGLVAYDSVVKAISSITHFFPCNDARGSTSLADGVGSLTGLNLHGNAMLGWQGIVSDGEPALHSPWGLSGDYVDLPTTLVSVTNPFTIEFWMESEFFASATQVFFSLDASKALDIYIDTSNYYNLQINNNDVNTGIKASPGRHHYVVSYDGSTVIRFYVDLVQMLFWPGTIPTLSGTGSLLRYANGSNNATPAAKFAKLASYNAVLSGTQMGLNYDAGNGV